MIQMTFLLLCQHPQNLLFPILLIQLFIILWRTGETFIRVFLQRTNDPCWISSYDRVWGYISVYDTSCTYHRIGADRNSWQNNGIQPNKAIIFYINNSKFPNLFVLFLIPKNPSCSIVGNEFYPPP